MEEIWKDVVGYEGLYQVSNMGRVKAIKTIINPRDLRYGESKNRMCKPTLQKTGYYSTLFYRNGKSTRLSIHRIVAEAFIPKEEGKKFIDHINGIKTDNRVENLRWVTPKENTNNPATKCNMRNMYNRLSKEEIARIREKVSKIKSNPIFQLDSQYNIIGEFDSITKASHITGYNQSSISSCRLNKCKLYGYYWVSKKDYEEFMKSIL